MITPVLIKHIASTFKKKFKVEPLLINSPGRINLIGEHTDYNEGFVFPAAIDQVIITAIQKSKSKICTVVADDLSETHEFSLNNTEALKNGNWKNYILGVVAEIQKKGKHLNNFNLVFGGNIAIGAGLSSSAALENSIVFGLNELFDLKLSKEEMILISQKAEHNYAGVKCGIMDQYASMFGEKNKALFLDCRTVKASPIEIDLKDHELLLINTNVKHSLAESAYNDRRSVCEKVAQMLNISALRDASEKDLIKIKSSLTEDDFQKASYVIQENNRVKKALEVIKNRDLNSLGKLFYASHRGLQHQFKVSCSELDFLVEKAKESPFVIGSRMMGGGFGGCTINIIKKDSIPPYSDFIKKEYLKKFNAACSFYRIRLSKGTHLINSVS